MARKDRSRGAPAATQRVLERSDRAICAEACGAKCCKASYVPLTEAETIRLTALAGALHLAPLPLAPYQATVEDPDATHILHALPCPFLGKSNRCLIYNERPDHCREFPRQLLEWCLLSQKYLDPDRTA